MIRKVSFRNFKAYRSVDVELEPLTVLVGPNASGKTTLLEGLSLVSSAVGGEADAPSRSVPVETRMYSYGTNASIELSVSGTWGDAEGLIKVSGENRSGQSNQDSKAHFSLSGTWRGIEFPMRKKGHIRVSDPSTPKVAYSEIFAALRSTIVLRLDPRRLAEASYSEEPIPKVEPDGSGLASVLAYLKLSQDEVFAEIETSLRQVVPAVRRIRVERAQVEKWTYPIRDAEDEDHAPIKQTLWGNQVILDMKGAKGIPVNAAGEGTLMALGLMTLLRGPVQPRLVLLDDVELALHPAAQAKLVEVLRSIQARNQDLQIVATSHSPFILNYLDPKEVRMTFLAENGFARCEKLTAHPEFEQWKDLMRPGEFWSTVGERWVGDLENPTSHE